jgi:hypothetical protein
MPGDVAGWGFVVAARVDLTSGCTAQDIGPGADESRWDVQMEAVTRLL